MFLLTERIGVHHPLLRESRQRNIDVEVVFVLDQYGLGSSWAKPHQQLQQVGLEDGCLHLPTWESLIRKLANLEAILQTHPTVHLKDLSCHTMLRQLIHIEACFGELPHHYAVFCWSWNNHDVPALAYLRVFHYVCEEHLKRLLVLLSLIIEGRHLPLRGDIKNQETYSKDGRVTQEFVALEICVNDEEFVVLLCCIIIWALILLKITLNKYNVC